jgi:hypothetical protein
MPQIRKGLDFPFEIVGLPLAEEHAAPENLESDLASGSLLFGKVDNRLAALAQDLEDPVRSDGVRRRRLSGFRHGGIQPCTDLRMHGIGFQAGRSLGVVKQKGLHLLAKGLVSLARPCKEPLPFLRLQFARFQE